MFYVWDARNNRVSGPFSTNEEASEFARQMCEYLNPLKFLGATARGPFYPMSEKQARTQGLKLPT